MSRAQSQTTFDTATDESKKQYDQSQDSYKQAQQGVGEYKTALAKFAAANPYTDGGSYQTAVNQGTSGIAAEAGGAANDQLQEQALRTGGNRAGAAATAEAIDQANTRNLMLTQAQSTADRLSKGSAYGGEVLGASATPEQMEAALAAGQAGLSQGNLSTAGNAAAANKGFWDTFGSSFATGLGQTLSGANSKNSGGASGLGMLAG